MSENWEDQKKKKNQAPEGAVNLDDQEANKSSDEEVIESTQDDFENGGLDSGQEKNEFRESSERWTDFFLNKDVLDQYALGYVQNKKPPEEKRKNGKYSKYLNQARQFQKKVSKRMEGAFESGELSADADQEEIEGFVESVLRSEMRATNLAKLVAGFDYKKNTDNPEKRDEPEDQPIKKEFDENLMTKESFFEKYKKGVNYVDSLTGKEIEIMDYDPASKKVKVSVVDPYPYDIDTKAYKFSVEKGDKEEEMSIEEFEGFMKESFTDEELQEEAKRERKEHAMESKKAFWKEFDEYKDSENLKILDFSYYEKFRKNLVKIKEKDQEEKLITREELRDLIKKLLKKPKSEYRIEREKLREKYRTGRQEARDEYREGIEKLKEQYKEQREAARKAVNAEERAKRLKGLPEKFGKKKDELLKQLGAKQDQLLKEFEEQEGELFEKIAGEKRPEEEVVTEEDFWKKFGYLKESDWFDNLDCKEDEKKGLSVTFKTKSDTKIRECNIQDFEKVTEKLKEFHDEFDKYDGQNGLTVEGIYFGDSFDISLVGFFLGEKNDYKNMRQFRQMVGNLTNFWDNFREYNNRNGLTILHLEINDFSNGVKKIVIRLNEGASQELSPEEFNVLVEKLFHEKLSEFEKQIFDIYDKKLEGVRKKVFQDWRRAGFYFTKDTLDRMVEDFLSGYIENDLFKVMQKELKDSKVNTNEESIKNILKKIKREEILKKIK